MSGNGCNKAELVRCSLHGQSSRTMRLCSIIGARAIVADLRDELHSSAMMLEKGCA